MKKNTFGSLLMIASVVTILNFSSCSKYDDGPNFTLRTKKARLTGEWEVVKMGGQNLDAGYELEFEFEKDGDFKWTYGYSSGGSSYSYTYSGEWEWEDDKEDIRISVNDGGSYSYNIDYKILRMTNKELVLEDTYGDEWELEKK